MIYLIVLLVGTLVGLLIGKGLYRHHYRQADRQLQESKAAVREMMYQTHHLGINPIAKRIRGLCTLGKMIVPKDQECFTLFDVIESQAQELEGEVLDKVKEFEHLQ